MCGYFIGRSTDFHCEIFFTETAYLGIVKYTLITSRYQIIDNADFFGFTYLLRRSYINYFIVRKHFYFLHIVTLPFVTAVTLSFGFSVIVIKQFQDGFGHLLLSVVFWEESLQILHLKTDMLGLIGFFL